MIYKHTKHLAILMAALTTLLVSGCATGDRQLYYWGDFQNEQYAYFKGERGPEDSILKLEKIREEAKSKGKSVPPGFEAHLGLLYGQAGRTDKFEQCLEAERQYFPESANYLDFLVKKTPKKKATR